MHSETLSGSDAGPCVLGISTFHLYLSSCPVMTYRIAMFPFLSFAWSHLLLAVPLSVTLQLACAAERPHILFILADDLSWSDLGCYGHPYHRTPHLDRLASEGVRFTSAYAPAPICSASRAAMLTGKTPARLHFEFVTKDHSDPRDLGQPLKPPPYPANLPLQEETVAEVLAAADYHTAFFGKWHLNQHLGVYLRWSATHGPLQQGFVEGDADFGSHPYGYYRDGDRDDLDLREGEFPPDSLTDKVIHFLQRPHAQPFFVHWSHYYVHDPVHTRCRWLFDKYRRQLSDHIPDIRVAYAAMVETLDHQVGRVLQSLDDAGIAEKTLLVFISDNGGHPNYSANAPHRGSKWNLYEGGIRVPLIARWPEHIRRGGECDQPVHGCDLPLTFAHFAKADWEANSAIDGISIAPLLLDPQLALPERSLTWHFPYYHPERGFQEAPSRIGINDFITSQTRPHSAIRLGRYKLLNFDEDGRVELYDLTVDPGESTNLAATHPALAGQLRDRLLSELRASGARFVTR